MLEKNIDAPRTLTIYNLGLIGYQEALNVQQELFNALIRNKRAGQRNSENYLLICEHKHVFTLGRNGNGEHLLLGADKLLEKDIEFYNTTRGGDITYHGPGQLVCYPILDLDNFWVDIGKYVRALEEVVIQTLAHYQIEGKRLEKLTGVWIKHPSGYAKICAIGIKCSRWVSMHGLAFNVTPCLDYFNFIIPCGIRDKAVTSLARELKRPILISNVLPLVIKNFNDIFGISSYKTSEYASEGHGS